MKISVILTTFNGEKYIINQLQSICNQSIIPSQIIICDDQSSDATLSKVESFAKTSKILFRISKNNTRLGVNKNFEKAIELCDQDADIIVFSDQDDIWESKKLEITLNKFKSSLIPRLTLIIHDCSICDIDMKEISKSLLNNVLIKKGSNKDFVHGCCTTIGSDLRDIIFPIPSEMNPIGYDEWMHMAADMLGVRIVQSDKLLKYRRHENNISNSFLYTKNNTVGIFINKLNSCFNHLKKRPGSTWLSKRMIASSVLKVRLTPLTKKDPSYLTQLEALLEIEATLNKRNKIRNSNFIIGIYLASLLYLQGGYASHSGYKSMIADILRL